jgi:hypothetical protein
MKTVKPFAPRKGSHVPLGNGFDLSIDPGIHTGWALWSGVIRGQLIACGTGEPPFEGVRRLVIELPQAYPNSPVPYNDLVTLAFQAGRYAATAGVDLDVQTVWPHTWKGNMPKPVCALRVRSLLFPEELAVLRECEKVVTAKQMHNVLDAIGVGLHAFRGGL